MKYQVTKKELNRNYYHIIRIGYCDAQYLLQYVYPASYCAGVYGWSCDNYDINGILISTGYNPLNNSNAVTEYEKTQTYENKARAVVCDYSIDYEIKKKLVMELLNEFIKECIQ